MGALPFKLFVYILRPRIFPWERLFCFRYRVERGEQPHCLRTTSTCRPVLLQSDELTTVHSLTCLPISTAPDRREGYLLSTTHSVLAYKGRHLGCSRRIRTSSSGYEPEMLPLHHHCDTAGVSSTPELYPNFSLSLAKLARAPVTYLSSVSGWRGQEVISFDEHRRRWRVWRSPLILSYTLA